MLKLAGASLVILASTGIGYYYSTQLRLHLNALLWMKKMVIMLKGEILYLNAPLNEAFGSVAERVPEPYKGFLESVSNRLSLLQAKPFYDIWCEEMGYHLKKSDLKEKDLMLLKDMGENLGYLDRQMQEKTLNLYLSQLEEEMDTRKAEIGQKSKIYQTLGVMGGIFITIVMM